MCAYDRNFGDGFTRYTSGGCLDAALLSGFYW